MLPALAFIKRGILEGPLLPREMLLCLVRELPLGLSIERGGGNRLGETLARSPAAH